MVYNETIYADQMEKTVYLPNSDDYRIEIVATGDGTVSYKMEEVTKGSGDYGIDILAQKDGVTYGIQCKCYATPVGVKAVQEAYAGRDYYDCMVGVVLTNQYFTTPAVEVAKKLKIMLWDRGYLESMMEEEE